MRKKIAFIVYYTSSNRYSFNALVGALETEKTLSDIEIFFINTKESLFDALYHYIQKYEYIVLAISFFTTQLWEIQGLMSSIKKKFGKRIFYIAGGPHPSGDPKGTLELGFDIIFIGEGEESLIEFLQNLKNGQDFRNIKGIAFLDENNIYQYTGKRTPIDLNRYPPFPVKHNKFGAIEITRGCPYVCYFCQTPFILGTNPRHRSIESICKYIRIMKSKNLTDIRFITPNAFSYGSEDGKNLNLNKLENLLQKIKEIILPRGKIFFGSFPSEVRPEHVNERTLDLILKYASNDNIIIGAQSGSQRVLDLCHREHSIEDVYNAVELTLSKNLKANVDFIFGLPGENSEDVKLTIKMMNNLVKKGAKIHTHSFIPLPNTPFAKKSLNLIDEKMKKAILKLTSSGNAFGDWKTQQRMAIKISKYLNQKKFN
ncbi:MAG: TIGR04013 family B12-binding domain/radical SAM domain-containing protein [Promethearchaeota archaeon]|nr:MAG: TIGR04013 family B12-binding domain/radical SAM domain-containing protein [Candidatus Lokiarchaeota archaeon]